MEMEAQAIFVQIAREICDQNLKPDGLQRQIKRLVDPSISQALVFNSMGLLQVIISFFVILILFTDERAPMTTGAPLRRNLRKFKAEQNIVWVISE